MILYLFLTSCFWLEKATVVQLLVSKMKLCPTSQKTSQKTRKLVSIDNTESSWIIIWKKLRNAIVYLLFALLSCYGWYKGQWRERKGKGRGTILLVNFASYFPSCFLEVWMWEDSLEVEQNNWITGSCCISH